jgi:hypothetical protein
MEEELAALRATAKQTKTNEERSEKSIAKKLKRDQTNKGVGQQVSPTSEDDMDVDGGSTDRPSRKQHSRVDYLKKS